MVGMDHVRSTLPDMPCHGPDPRQLRPAARRRRQQPQSQLPRRPREFPLGRSRQPDFLPQRHQTPRQLQALVVRTLVYAIQNGVQEAFREGRRSRIWLDEAWSFLQTSSDAASFLHEAYRAFRHWGAGIVCITQQPGDFRGDAGETIRSNSGTEIFLPMTRDQIGLCQGPLRLTDPETAAIERLRTLPGVYSEFFVRTGDEMRGTLRYPCPPEIYWLCATASDDMRLLDPALEANGGNVGAAVRWLARHHPGGAAGGRRAVAVS